MLDETTKTEIMEGLIPFEQEIKKTARSKNRNANDYLN